MDGMDGMRRGSQVCDAEDIYPRIYTESIQNH